MTSTSPEIPKSVVQAQDCPLRRSVARFELMTHQKFNLKFSKFNLIRDI